MRFALLAALAAFCFACPPAQAQAPAQSGGPLPSRAAAAALHPANILTRSAEFLQAGRADEAVFWFYLGQLRYRAYLAAHPDLPRDRDPALFASLLDVIGRPVNEYAFGDIPALARTIDEVLAFDAAHPDPMTPKDRFGAERDRIRSGLARMRDETLARADEVRAMRARNGLRNRS